MEQLLCSCSQEVSLYFLTGRAERVLKAVSAPDFAPLNTEGAALPIFSAKNQTLEYFTVYGAVDNDARLLISALYKVHTHIFDPSG